MEYIGGRGRFGSAISGDIDLDNIDNVFRMAYHMGFPESRDVPLRLARAMVDFDKGTRQPVFKDGAAIDIELWRSTRRQVYEHLMPARSDFAGKAMLLFATIKAFEVGEIGALDWSLTDFAFMVRLLSSKSAYTRNAAERWIAGELWDLTPLQWMDGKRPDYSRMLAFSHELSASMDRECLAYGIQDKRDRQLTIHFQGGGTETFGEHPRQWLLGVGSPERRAFTVGESKAVFELARAYFETAIVGPVASRPKQAREVQPSLL